MMYQKPFWVCSRMWTMLIYYGLIVLSGGDTSTLGGIVSGFGVPIEKWCVLYLNVLHR